MKTVVITGSTRGIGHGLAVEFLKRGCAVVISGRNKSVVDKEAQQLAQTYGRDRVAGIPCEVTDLGQVQALWDGAKKIFGHVDIWIIRSC